MPSIPISPGTLKTLAGESSGNWSILKQLCRNTVCSLWLKSSRIPCWRNPSLKGYDMMFSDGSRIKVCSFREAELSLNLGAAAGCFGAVAVEMADDLSQGEVKGFIPLSRFPVESCTCLDLSSVDLESPSDFFHYLYRPAGYLRTFFIFSARLLLFGEPYPPERGTGETAKFTPALTGMREE